MKRIIITTGDPAAIGPEISGKAIEFYQLNPEVAYVFIGNIIPSIHGHKIHKISHIEEADKPQKVYWLPIINKNIEIGKPSKESGSNSLQILELAAKILNAKQADAVVTCPISKKAIQLTNKNFIGHTEFFAQKSQTQEVIMSFWSENINLSLLTTHLPLSKVSSELTKEKLIKKFDIIIEKSKELLIKPKIAVLGINPHLGEDGAFGNEDKILSEVITQYQNKEVFIEGPFPADTFFGRGKFNHDMIISAYHDQGLIPFKMLSGGLGVNVTLGLPFIRTSVDHGTAFDIAGHNIADEKSLIEAIRFAENSLHLNQQIIPDNTYSNFAHYYDNYMEHVSYDEWVKLILNQFENIKGKNPQKILEIACGTGNVACKFKEKGYNISASDLSPEMLKIASKKKNAPILFQGNMLEEYPEKDYDLILSLFDSVNYLRTKDEFMLLLSNVYNHLENGGLFIFDITTSENCIENFDGYVNIEDEDDEFFVHESEWDDMSRIQRSKLVFFQKVNSVYKKYIELHEQRIFLPEAIINWVENSNFTLKGIFTPEKEENLLHSNWTALDYEYTRLFFILEK